MIRITRRRIIKTGFGAAAGVALVKRASSGALAQGTSAQTAVPSADLGLPVLGKVTPRASLAVNASPLGIGFETLDRRIFDPTRTYDHLAKLGVKWARCQTGWARTETTKGVYDFKWLDDVVDSLIKIGIKPWFNLGYGNRLYTPGADEYAVGWIPMSSAEAREGWLNYTRKIAEHFGSRVQHWELWNEPNITAFWKPSEPNPVEYAEFVKITAPEIRRRVPQAVIIGGAFAGIPNSLDYLERCLDAGMAEHIDRLSYHPYRAVPEENYETDVRAYRHLLARYKQGVGLWQGENGAPSQNGGLGALSNLDWNETRQAKWLLRRILIDLKVGVEMTSYFQTVDMTNYTLGGAGNVRTGTNFKGVLRGTDYTTKPSYFAYQSLCALFDGETKPADLLLRLEKVGAAATVSVSFMRGERPLYVYWSPANLQQEYGAGKIDVNVWTGRAVALTNPVLINPLTSQVYRLEPKKNGGFLRFEGMPLMDYPLIITDKTVLGTE